MGKTSGEVQGGLFRLAALEHAGAPDGMDLGVHVVRAPQWLLLAAALAFAICALVFSFVLPVPTKVQASGILITQEGLKNIESQAAGRVKDIFVGPGDFVRQGQKIAQIEQPDLAQQQETAEAELANLHNRYDRVVGFQGQNKADLEAQQSQKRRELESLIASHRSQIEWLEKSAAGLEDLARKGFASQQRLYEARVKLNEARAEMVRNANALNALKFEENNKKIEREREMLDLEVKIEQARTQVTAIRERRQRQTFLESPYDGVVVEQKLNLGELVEVGKPILGLLPGTETEDADGLRRVALIATLYLSSGDGKKVRPGMAAQIVPSTVKREEFGFILGRITQVAVVPSSPEGMMRTLKNRQLVDTLSKGGAPFEASAVLEMAPDTPSGFKWSSSKGPDQTIGAGGMVSAEVVVKEQPLISLLMPALRRLLGAAR